MSIFQFLNDKIHNYVKQNIIVDFIIQKVKKHTQFSQKVYRLRKLNSLILTEREETKTRYFAPRLGYKGLFNQVQLDLLST